MNERLKFSNALVFSGDCAEAVTYYERVFGIKAKKVLRYKDVPEIKDDDVYPLMKEFYESDLDLVRMAVLEIGGVEFRLFDLVDHMNMDRTERVSFMIIDTVENASMYYENMVKEGGEVYVPPQKRFFSDFNAAVVDRFGFMWTFDGGYKF